jgi:hypothetical protein
MTNVGESNPAPAPDIMVRRPAFAPVMRAALVAARVVANPDTAPLWPRGRGIFPPLKLTTNAEHEGIAISMAIAKYRRMLPIQCENSWREGFWTPSLYTELINQLMSPAQARVRN